MSSAAGIPRRIPFTFLNSPRSLANRFVSNPKVLVLIVATLLMSVQLLYIAALQAPRSEDQDENTARAALVTISNFTISPQTVYVGQTVHFFANASSDVGTGLKFTIYYDYVLSDGVTPNPYSPTSVNNTGNPGSIVQTHVYEWPGNCTGSTFQVALIVDDGVTTKLKVKFVTILENTAPVFQDALEGTYKAEVGVPLEFSVNVSDNDDDALNLTWDFGDGTAPVVQSTGPAGAGVVCNQSHAWNPPPELVYGIGDINIYYYLKLSLEDGYGHYMNTTTEIYIVLPHNFNPQGNMTTASTTIDPGDDVTICAAAMDPEGEPLTWTFLFSNSLYVYHTEVFRTPLTAPGTILFINFTHCFAEPGSYIVSFYLCDVWLPENQTGVHNVTAGILYLSSVVNRAPIVIDYIQVSPAAVQINETTGVAQALFWIQTNDYDGDVLTATWDFGDGTSAAVNVTQGGTQMYTLCQMHEFAIAGPYNVSVRVTDGREGHEVLRYKLLNVTSNNSAPQVKDFVVMLSNVDHGVPGSVVQFVITLFDKERDPLTVSWNFGDGSPVEWTNTTVFNETGYAVFRINHTYAEEGNYSVLINFTDNKYGMRGLHLDSWSGLAIIDLRAEDVIRVWDWWDYTSLSLFIVSIGLLVMWSMFGVIRRRRMDRMGITLEEYLLRKNEMEQYDRKQKGGEGLR